ncbi:transcriptional regulator [Pseudomonas sp. S34]|nr:transcriptional regulator [Pseudomonas sp. S34]
MNYRHRDYFDAGALLYEHLPVLSRAIAWLKRRLG